MSSDSEKVKPVALAGIKLCLPEGIMQAGRQAVWQAVIVSRKKIFLTL